jgi:RNA 2',3'-cyclic 3'-phosphodiesterase
MAEQFALERFNPPPKPTDRLFFAIFPSADIAERIAQLAQQLRAKHGLKGKLLATGRFHVTLHHLGDFVGLPQAIVATACEAAASVAMPPFDVAFDRAMSFNRPSNRPFVLRGGAGLAALMPFQQALSTALNHAGLGDGKANAHFTPHVTLLYDDRDVAEQAIEPITWAVNEFVLMRSLIGKAQHIPLARWALLP